MNINKKWLVSGAVAFFMVWALNIAIYESRMLKEPLFMKHYYDLNYIEDIQIHYARNKGDDLKIYSLTFPELELGDFPVRFQEIQVDSLDRYYDMVTLMLQLDREYFEHVFEEREVLITKMDVEFSDGSRKRVDIGEICISSIPYEKKVFESHSVGSSSDNTGYNTMRAVESVSIKGIKSRIPEPLLKAANVKVGGKPLEDLELPLEISASENVNISYGFSFHGDDDIRKLYYIQMDFGIISETKSGKEGADFAHIHYNPYLAAKDIIKLKDAGGTE